jgi:hypothetical protein
MSTETHFTGKKKSYNSNFECTIQYEQKYVMSVKHDKYLTIYKKKKTLLHRIPIIKYIN